MLRTPCGPPCDAVEVVGGDPNDLAESEGDDGEIVLSQTQCRGPKNRPAITATTIASSRIPHIHISNTGSGPASIADMRVWVKPRARLRSQRQARRQPRNATYPRSSKPANPTAPR